MESAKAFAMGDLNRDRPLRVFDWDKAATIIVSKRATSAEAGLRGDWEWTGGEILADGEPVPVEDTYTYLGSTWAVPELVVGEEAPIPCWRYADETGWDAHTYWPESALRILRSPLQN